MKTKPVKWQFDAFALPLFGTTIHFLLEAADFLFGAPALMAAVAWNLAVLNLILDALRIDEAPEKIALRKKLISARAYFKKQLRSPAPDLHDDWFPYVLAFGLGSNVDSWFRAYGSPGTNDRTDRLSPSSSTSTSSRDSAWTGGGGISSSSSSSGDRSSGGGGGGSSSGGGSGGGW